MRKNIFIQKDCTNKHNDSIATKYDFKYYSKVHSFDVKAHDFKS